jgi:capsular polysaccharide biosynthesis protein
VSEQIVDLRSSWAILRRHGRALAVAAALGALVGGALVYVLPGAYTSTSKVLLPAVPADSGGQVGAHDIDTQVEIALSDVVLGRAGRTLHPPLNADKVAQRVEIVAPTTDVLVITAKGASRAQAEALAGAVAVADVDYLRQAASSLSEDQRATLSERAATLAKNLDAVTSALKRTQNLLRQESPRSTAGKAYAAAIAELTAEQANVALQIDEVKGQQGSGSQPLNGQPGGGVSVIQKASPAERTPLVVRIAMFSGLGLALAILGIAIYLLLTGRREHTLRSRDQIADAIGVPVVASLQSRTPRGVAGWGSLLQGYDPADVDRWALRQLLRLVTPGTPGSLSPAREDDAEGSTKVVVVTLSDDSQALAVGPQFAAFAASMELTTQLVAAQPHDAAAALWAACARIPEHEEARPGLFVDSRQDLRYKGDLIVYIAVLDRRRPELYLYGANDAVTLLALTPGSATAEDLARLAVAVDDAGHPLGGLIVANPDPLDRTTGRVLPTERAQQVPLPSLMTGSAIAGEAAAPATRRRTR